jgi:hypothetical protein
MDDSWSCIELTLGKFVKSSKIMLVGNRLWDRIDLFGQALYVVVQHLRRTVSIILAHLVPRGIPYIMQSIPPVNWWYAEAPQRGAQANYLIGHS